METGMIEKVARAIYETEPFEVNLRKGMPWEDVDESQKAGFRVKARAAIEAMRDRSAAMSEAMRIANMNVAGGYDGPSGWEAAIDAALAEQEEKA